jgi:hypothetical protein
LLRRHALEGCLVRSWLAIGEGVLLLLLDTELRLGNETSRLGHQSVLGLGLSHEARGLRLHLGLQALLIQFGQALPRSSNWRPCLGKSSQLRLQWRGPKGILLL